MVIENVLFVEVDKPSTIKNLSVSVRANTWQKVMKTAILKTKYVVKVSNMSMESALKKHFPHYAQLTNILT